MINATSLKSSFLPAISWFIIVTVLLCLPGTEFPKISWLNKIFFDKWVHIGLFMTMVIFWCRAFTDKKTLNKSLKKTFIAIMIMSITYGIIMEIIQHYFIPFRSFEAGDILADSTGSLVGYLFSFRRYIKK